MFNHVNNTEFWEGGGGQNPKGKTQLGRNWCRWEENITLDLTEIKRKGVDMIKVNMSWKIRFYKRQDIS